MPTSRGVVAARCEPVGHARRWPGLAMLVPGAPSGSGISASGRSCSAARTRRRSAVGAFAWGTAVGRGARGLRLRRPRRLGGRCDRRSGPSPASAAGCPPSRPLWRWAAGIYGPLAVLGALVAWPRLRVARAAVGVRRRPAGLPGRGPRSWPGRPRLARPGPSRARGPARTTSWRGRGTRSPGPRGRLEVAGRRFPLSPFRAGPGAACPRLRGSRRPPARRLPDRRLARAPRLGARARRPRRGPGLGQALPRLGAAAP